MQQAKGLHTCTRGQAAAKPCRGQEILLRIRRASASTIAYGIGQQRDLAKTRTALVARRASIAALETIRPHTGSAHMRTPAARTCTRRPRNLKAPCVASAARACVHMRSSDNRWRRAGPYRAVRATNKPLHAMRRGPRPVVRAAAADPRGAPKPRQHCAESAAALDRGAVPRGCYLRATREWLFALRALAQHSVGGLTAAQCTCATPCGSAAHARNNDRAPAHRYVRWRTRRARSREMG